MANIYQQAAKRRKVIYLSTIAVLLLSTLVVRGTIKIPVPGVRDVAYDNSIEGRARRHELSELSQGDAELGGSAVRLLLTGSRGLAVCALWNSAIEKQRRQEWSELDIAVKSITKLQPHFTSPWLFQSWNITYNVSVEMDRLNDMYYYIARGISIIAEGEAMNRNNPDLRYNLGFYYQNKFGVSDKVTTLRCLYQLSCIPDEFRDPEKLLNPDRSINSDKFETFCRTNPQLIRRLKNVRVAASDGVEAHAKPLVATPKDVIDFLRANKKLPSRYKTNTTELNDRLKQFPVLPELKDQPIVTKELDYHNDLGDHESDAFLVSREWYAMANVAIPPPNPLPTGEVGEFDPYKYRMPKRPTLMVFRQGPVRAQSYHAERLTKEGWFDHDPYELDEELDSNVWIKKTDDTGKPVSVKFTTPTVAQDAWKEASVRWREHGRANGLYLEPAQVARYNTLAEDYCRSHPGLSVGRMPEPLTAEESNDQVLKARHEAMLVMNGYFSYRSVTNYETFDIESEAMSTDDAMLALKLFDKAGREIARFDKAAALYEQGFAAWKRLLSRQECRTRGSDNAISSPVQCKDFRDNTTYQETMYEKNVKYQGVAQTLHLIDRRLTTLWLHDLLRHAAFGTAGNPFQFAGDLTVLYDRVPVLKGVTPLPVPGPLDGDAESDGKPWINDDIKTRVREKLGLIKRAPEPAKTAPVGEGSPPPGP